MDEDRTVHMIGDVDAWVTLEEHTNYKEVQLAIGYLSTWGRTMYATCKLYVVGKDEIRAVYTSADGKRTYVIGAVWHEGHFGFHS